MNRRSSALILSLILFSSSAMAQQHHGGGGGGGFRSGGGGGGFQSSGATRSNFSPARAPMRTSSVRTSNGGFNFNRDVNASEHSPVYNSPNRVMAHPVMIGNTPQRHGIIDNPNFRGRPRWNWNHGIHWEPAPAYWGGGFWGPFGLGATIGGITYAVTADTPGSELLENYHLTQTPCGPPDLVVIFGPDTSEICAYPNDIVSPGEYTIDLSTLTLVGS